MSSVIRDDAVIGLPPGTIASWAEVSSGKRVRYTKVDDTVWRRFAEDGPVDQAGGLLANSAVAYLLTLALQNNQWFDVENTDLGLDTTDTLTTSREDMS